ncbi:hypothetical protein KKB55_11095 [Myxococcota bacterium]|nr:hypothetical protein [Myxococcota bacterium]
MRPPALIIALILTPLLALARPQEQTVEDTDADVTLSLTLLEQAIEGDERGLCTMRIIDVGEAVELREGDIVRVWLSEDDLVGDDDIFDQTLTVTAAEAAANHFDRLIDCSTAFGEDINADFEFYARAEVQKAECGFWCLYDRPRTAPLSLITVQDDDWEDNDRSQAAAQLALGFHPDFICADQDWYSLTLLDQGLLSVDVMHAPRAGRLEVDVFDLNEVRRGTGVAHPEGTLLEAGPLPAGDYLLRITPSDGLDFNFYDLALRLLTDVCTPGAVERVPCARCGWQTRFCGADQRWGAYSECEGGAECTPGDTRQRECGRCGLELETCSEECYWTPGICTGEGECRPSEVFEELCDEARGRRARSCDSACFWSEWSPCQVDACQPDEARACYTGPVGTAGIGACEMGESRCFEGEWGPCEGQAQPRNEVCDDLIDNDCDGAIDGVDRDCGGDIDVGDLCHLDADCGDLMLCVIAPEHPGFHSGDCSFIDCLDGGCPDGAACGSALGVRLCLKRCGVNSDCRPDHVCADAATDMGGLACVPRCLSDEDCRAPDLPRCEASLGLCLPGGAPIEDAGVAEDAAAPPLDAEIDPVEDAATTPAPDMGDEAPPSTLPDGGPRLDTAPDPEGCGCQQRRGGDDTPFWLALLAILVAMIPLRRRAHRRGSA